MFPWFYQHVEVTRGGTLTQTVGQCLCTCAACILVQKEALGLPRHPVRTVEGSRWFSSWFFPSTKDRNSLGSASLGLEVGLGGSEMFYLEMIGLWAPWFKQDAVHRESRARGLLAGHLSASPFRCSITHARGNTPPTTDRKSL